MRLHTQKFRVGRSLIAREYSDEAAQAFLLVTAIRMYVTEQFVLEGLHPSAKTIISFQ